MGKRNQLAAVLLVGGSLLGGSLLGGCAYEQEKPFDPRGMGDSSRLGAAEPRPATSMPAMPTTLESPYLPSQPLNTIPRRPDVPRMTSLESGIRLPLREVIQRAVVNNLDIRVAGYDPAIENTRVVEAEARFDPTVFAETGLDYRNVSTAGQVFGFGSPADFTEETLLWNSRAGIRQLLPSGGQAELRLQTGRTDRDPTFNSLNPYWENEIVLQVTQPLLRDFGNEINQARIVINRNNVQVSVLEFRKRVEETLFDLEQRYWELAQAMEDNRIAEDLLEQTIDTADILFKRRGQDVTSVQVGQAIASIKARTAALIESRRRILDLSDQIKRLMGDPDLPVTGATLILPESTPLVEPVRFDLEDALETALLCRLELGQQQLRVDSASTALQVAKNNLLPQLNLVASAGLQGLDDTWGQAVGEMFDFNNNLTGSVGVQLEWPVGNRAARAIFARASLQRQQAIDSYGAVVQQVALDVKSAIREVETAWEFVVQQQQNRLAQAAALDALLLREKNNEPLTPNFVDLKLNLQGALAEARRNEARAVAAYNVAIARLERAKGTLLKYNNVVLEQSPNPIRR